MAVDVDDAYANLALPAKIREFGLSSNDAGLATELTYGTLRMQGFYDRVIANAAARDIDTIDLVVLNILRMGVHQLLNMRVAQHAAVDESVNLAEHMASLGAVGFGLSLTTIAFAPSYEMFALSLPLGGCIALLTLVSANSYVQTSTRQELRGRVMGIYLLIFMGGTPLGSPLIGFMADLIGIRYTIFACGLVVVTGALISLMLLRSAKLDKAGGVEPSSDTSAINVVAR